MWHEFLYRASGAARHCLNVTWGWFNSLNQGEWLVVLGIAAGLGLLCMRGFGSRQAY